MLPRLKGCFDEVVGRLECEDQVAFWGLIPRPESYVLCGSTLNIKIKTAKKNFTKPANNRSSVIDSLST